MGMQGMKSLHGTGLSAARRGCARCAERMTPPHGARPAGPRAEDGRAASAVRTQVVAGTRVERASPGGYPGVGTAPTTPLKGRRTEARRSGLSPLRPVDADIGCVDERSTSSLTPSPFAPAKLRAM